MAGIHTRGDYRAAVRLHATATVWRRATVTVEFVRTYTRNTTTPNTTTPNTTTTAASNPRYYLTTATAGQAYPQFAAQGQQAQGQQPPAAATQPEGNQYYGAMSAPHHGTSALSHGVAGGGCQSCGPAGHGGAYGGYAGGYGTAHDSGGAVYNGASRFYGGGLCGCGGCGGAYGYDGYGAAASGYGAGCYGYGGGCWYASVGGLVMKRDRAYSVWLSFDDSDPAGRLLGSRDAEMGWTGGYEITIGRHFCGGLRAVEATYWGLSQTSERADVFRTQITPGASLNTALDFSALNIGIDNVNDWYDDAEHHRLRRSYEFHNLELNMLHGPLHLCNPCGSGLRVNLVCGVRFFRFEEMFGFDTADTDPTFGVLPDDEVYYEIDIKNDLVGVQLGCLAEYDLTRCVRLFADVKCGMYRNHISHRSTVYNRNGVGIVGPGNPTAGAAFDINSKKDDLAFLGELELGAEWQFTPCWSGRIGYRVVAVGGVAMTVEQIPVSFADVGGVADIDSNGHLILHGLHASVEKRW